MSVLNQVLHVYIITSELVSDSNNKIIKCMGKWQDIIEKTTRIKKIYIEYIVLIFNNSNWNSIFNHFGCTLFVNK